MKVWSRLCAVISFIGNILQFLKQVFRKNELTFSYLSNNFIVIEKGYDIVINDRRDRDGDDRNSVEKQLRKLFPHLMNPNLVNGFHWIHRLDFSTSGLMCVGLNKSAARSAQVAFRQRLTRKFYLALVYGRVPGDCILINVPICPDTSDTNAGSVHRMKVARSSAVQMLYNKPGRTGELCAAAVAAEDGISAVTKLLVLQIGWYMGQEATKILLKPITGRRHQIRVHCSFIGNTIIGDSTYSSKSETLPYRMFLHSHRIVLPTPTETVDVIASDPFTEFDARNGWTPSQTINKLDYEIFRLMEDASVDVTVQLDS